MKNRRFNIPLTDSFGMDDLAFTVKKMPGKIVMGVLRRTSNADGRSIKDIPACWGDFLKQNVAAKISNRAIPPVMYAVYSDYKSDWKGEYSYLIGCGVTRAETVPEGLAILRIPPQTCAVFKVKGQMPDEVLATWSMIWLSSLPRNYTYDFEVYDQRFTRPKKKEVDICIGIDPNLLDSVK
jgi:predicted transcriptional regulator YdeE